MIGKLLNHRYHILEKVGGGGMALVYKAQDTLLNRVVAVKVLQPHFVEDEEFIRRFRREAEAAASLSHPNIVNVYDVGTTEENHFIVMEYIRGSSLDEVIQKQAPLEIDKAVDISIQICDALEEAHNNGIVHRDIKPHNIIITNEGRVKVTDFGIAQATTSLTMTQPSSVLGSVHYSSPEQARGGFVDARSDLYSLGVVMYEMLTKEVPFEGESAVTIALKHIQEPIRPPTQWNPSIPKNFERIIARALEKDTLLRYQSAKELRGDLELFYTNGQISRETSRYNPGMLPRHAPTQTYPSIRRKVEGEHGETVDKPNRKRLLWIIAGLVLLVGLALVGALALPRFFHVPDAPVPDLMGRSRFDAEKEAREQGFTLSVIREDYHSDLPANSVLYQDPQGGDLVKKGRTIEVIVSRGPRVVKVEDVVNKPLREVELILKGQNLDVGVTTEEFHPEIPAGYIVNQNPRAGTDVIEGTEVDLVVSRGSKESTVVVPRFIGKPIEDIIKEISESGLRIGRTDQQLSEEAAIGIVIAQSIEENQRVPRDSKIDLVVSQGRLKRTTVRFDVPQGPSSQTVQIVVVTKDGSRTVYEQLHSPGDQVVETVEWAGETARIQVIIDGLVRSDSTVQ